jgi:hypothetical protein
VGGRHHPARRHRQSAPPNSFFVLLNTSVRAEKCHCRFFPLGKNALQTVANKSLMTSKPFFRLPMSEGEPLLIVPSWARAIRYRPSLFSCAAFTK